MNSAPWTSLCTGHWTGWQPPTWSVPLRRRIRTWGICSTLPSTTCWRWGCRLCLLLKLKCSAMRILIILPRKNWDRIHSAPGIKHGLWPYPATLLFLLTLNFIAFRALNPLQWRSNAQHGVLCMYLPSGVLIQYHNIIVSQYDVLL